MTHLTGPARAAYVQSLFTRIARRYDVLNRLMTGGQDLRWRKQVIDLAQLPRGGWLLDLGTGTGDLAFEALRRDPTLRVTGGDFTLAMMRVGQARPAGGRVKWAGTDALHLPFPDGTFDAVVSGYLMRNVEAVPPAWAEQYRVLKPGGRGVCLDTTPPPAHWVAPRYQLLLARHHPRAGAAGCGRGRGVYLPAHFHRKLFTRRKTRGAHDRRWF